MNRAPRIQTAMLMTAALCLCAPTSADESMSPLRRAEALRALADSCAWVYPQLTQKISKSSPSLSENSALAKAWALHFQGRAHLARDDPEAAKQAFSQSRSAFGQAKEPKGEALNDAWIKACQSQAEIKTAYTLSSQQSWGSLSKADAWTLSCLSEDQPSAAPKTHDLDLVVGRSQVAGREVLETLAFNDALRWRLASQAWARRALKEQGLSAEHRAQALILAERWSEAEALLSKAESGPSEALSDTQRLVLKGQLSALKGSREDAQEPWTKAQAAGDEALARVTRLRALVALPSEGLGSVVKDRLKALREQAGRGPVGLRRHLKEDAPLLWASALYQARLARGTANEGVMALQALETAESQFPAGERGELFKHRDPRFAFLLGELYIQAHRYREALSYVYDPEALLSAFPEAMGLRRALQDLSLLESLNTDDEAVMTAESQGGALPVAEDSMDPADSGNEGEPVTPEAGPDKGPSSLKGPIVVAVGLLLLGLSAWRMAKS